MSWYALPVIIGLLIKIGILCFTHRRWGYSKTFISLIIILAAHNLTEVFIFIDIANSTTAPITLRAYYACILGILAYIACHAIEVSHIKKIQCLRPIILILGILASVLVIFTNHIIAGAQPLGQSLTRIPGDYYWIFQLSALGATIFSITILIFGYQIKE